ncbi:MAG: hypothetical protein GY756_11170 [bacterium]|nr:hypothetical protein [bacterium]
MNIAWNKNKINLQWGLLELVEKSSEMETEYYLIKEKKDLNGTCYFEFLPGKYQEKCWNDNSVFLNSKSFNFIEFLLLQICSGFNRYAFTELSKNQVHELIRILDETILEIKFTDNYAFSGKEYSKSFYLSLAEKLKNNKSQILKLLEDFENWLGEVIDKYDVVSVLGL